MSGNYEQFEIEFLVQDREVGGVATADTDDVAARNLISELVDADVATPVPGDHVLVHERVVLPLAQIRNPFNRHEVSDSHRG